MKELARHLAQAFGGKHSRPSAREIRNAEWDVENALSDFPQAAREALFALDLAMEDIHRLMVEIYYAETFGYVAHLPDSESVDDDALAMALEQLAAEVESHEPTNLAELESNPAVNLRASVGPDKSYRTPVYLARVTVTDTKPPTDKRIDSLLKKIADAVHDYEPAMSVDLWLTQGARKQLTVSVIYSPDDTEDGDRAESVYGIAETALGWAR